LNAIIKHKLALTIKEEQFNKLLNTLIMA